MKDKYKKLANLTFIIHWLWVVLMVISLPLVIIFDGYKIVALNLVALNILSWVIFRDCPFLKLENYFRKKHNFHWVYRKEFLAFYTKRFISNHISHRFVQITELIYFCVLIIFSII